MSAAKENPCRKFQANFFNKSKCQNCFKPRELHLLTDQDLTQVSRILCFYIVCINFNSPIIYCQLRLSVREAVVAARNWKVGISYFYNNLFIACTSLY